MPLFPKIQSPCPYKGKLSDILEGDLCRLCKRQVVDLTAMRSEERVAFLAGCSTQQCVSYRIRPALAAASVAALLGAPTVAAAQETAPPPAEAVDVPAEEWIYVGGITDPAHVQLVDVQEDNSVPVLPVTYEAEPLGDGADDQEEQKSGAPRPEITSPAS